MSHFISGFANELVKLGAFPQQHQDQDIYDAGSPVATVLDKSQGPDAKAGLKTPGIVQTPPASKKRAPTPLTTPNHMVDYASRS